MELYALQRSLADLEKLGAGLVAISPQLAHFNAETRDKHRIAYPILSDNDNSFARQLGVVHGLPDDLKELYAGFGIDLPATNGTDNWDLPLATRLVADRNGTVISVEADADYTIRPEPAATLEVVKALV